MVNVLFDYYPFRTSLVIKLRVLVIYEDDNKVDAYCPGDTLIAVGYDLDNEEFVCNDPYSESKFIRVAKDDADVIQRLT